MITDRYNRIVITERQFLASTGFFALNDGCDLSDY
jgi:hypothetical protein